MAHSHTCPVASTWDRPSKGSRWAWWLHRHTQPPRANLHLLQESSPKSRTFIPHVNSGLDFHSLAQRPCKSLLLYHSQCRSCSCHKEDKDQKDNPFSLRPLLFLLKRKEERVGGRCCFFLSVCSRALVCMRYALVSAPFMTLHSHPEWSKPKVHL